MMAIDGTYKIIAKAPMGNQEGILIYKMEGDALTGSMTQGKNVFEFENGKFDGTHFEHVMKFKTPMGAIKTNVSGTLDGENISGTFKAMMTTMHFSGTRVSE